MVIDFENVFALEVYGITSLMGHMTFLRQALIACRLLGQHIVAEHWELILSSNLRVNLGGVPPRGSEYMRISHCVVYPKILHSFFNFP